MNEVSIQAYTPVSPKDDEFQCSICWDPDKIDLIVITKCRHIYHRSCVRSWFLRERREGREERCPYCQRVVDLTKQNIIFDRLIILEQREENEVFKNTSLFGALLFLGEGCYETWKLVSSPYRGREGLGAILFFSGLKIALPITTVSLGDWYKGSVGKVIGGISGYVLTELFEKAILSLIEPHKIPEDELTAARTLSHTLMFITLTFQAVLYSRR